MDGPCLLLRHDKAGDAIKSLPALRALRARVPRTELHLLVSTHNASLFEKEPGFHVHSLPSHWALLNPEVLSAHLGHSGLPAAFSRVVSLLCDGFAETDRLLSLFKSTETYAASVVDPGLRDRVNVLKLPRNSPAKRDESLNIALLLSQAFDIDVAEGIETFTAAPVLTDEDTREARALMGEKTGTWLGFCPFAGLKNRSHPLKRWEAFLPQATRTPHVDKFFLFGAPSDCRALEILRDRCYHPEKVQLCFPSSFRTLGAYLLRLDGVVAVDSGPLHLARAQGVRSLGILSGGDAERWFASLTPGDQLLKRGILNRFPSAFEMTWAFRRWLRPSFSAAL
jgi:ADP-heptose:LPS heptosyltransferase